MQDTLRFLVDHGYVVLFVFVFLEQIGAAAAGDPGAARRRRALPAWGRSCPASRSRSRPWPRFSPTASGTGSARCAAAASSTCCAASRSSPTPASASPRTRSSAGGARSLLIAKFMPGLQHHRAADGGHHRRCRCGDSSCSTGSAPCSTSGPSSSSAGSGATRSRRSPSASRCSGGRVPLVLGAALVAWMLAKFARRWLFLRQLRIARITPEELKQRMDSGETMVVVDLRHAADVRRGRASAFRARSASPSTTSSTITIAFRAIARSSSSVRDRTRRPAPGWRCGCGSEG